jgi:hypothetical protein
MGIVAAISKQLQLEENRIRGILLESPDIVATNEEKQCVFNAAQEKGLDSNKLRIGCRIHTRKQAIEDVLRNIETHPTWKKDDILSYIRYSATLLKRVEKKVLPEFFD